jgi:hypothetical protein
VHVGTLPAQLILEEANGSTTASRAYHAVFPLGATGYEIVKAVLSVREVKDCFLKALRFVGAFHNSIVPQKPVLLKYIVTGLRSGIRFTHSMKAPCLAKA